MTLLQRLGFKADERLLMINSDDFGMCHAANLGTWKVLTEGYGTSASILVPCPWTPQALEWSAKRPDLSIGIELCLTSEWETYRWGPVASRDKVPSLVDPDGYFWGNNELVHDHVKVEEAEIELRAQIERAHKAGLKPSHFVNHMGSLSRSNRPDLRQLYVKLSREYRLPSRGPFKPYHQVGAPLYYLGSGKGPKLLEIVKALEPGLSELYPHCAVDAEELRSATHCSRFVPDDQDSWRGRVSDVEIYTDLSLKKAILEMGVKFISWREITERLRRLPAAQLEEFIC